MRAIMTKRRRRYVEMIAVMVEKPAIQASPTVNEPVASDIATPKPKPQPQFGVKPHSSQMA